MASDATRFFCAGPSADVFGTDLVWNVFSAMLHIVGAYVRSWFSRKRTDVFLLKLSFISYTVVYDKLFSF